MNTETPSFPHLPPRISRLRKWLRRFGWAFVWLITLLVLTAAVENFLGARAWRAAEERARAAGDPTDPAQVIPPPAADAENFAAIPLFDVLFNDEPPAGPVDFMAPRKSRDPAAMARVEGLKLPPAKTPGSWRKGQFVDLAVWQRELKVEEAGGTPGAAVLGALRQYDPDLDALREAAKRPRSRFPIRYQDHVAAALPHAGVLMNLTRIAALRAVAELAEGNTGAADADLHLALALADAPREDPLLISQLVRIASFETAFQPLWEGLARRQWSDAQLAALEPALQRPDFPTAFQTSMQGERLVFCVQVLDAVKLNPALLRIISSSDLSRGTWQTRAASWLIPDGWIDFNKVALSDFYERLIRATDPQAHQFFPPLLEEMDQTFAQEHGLQRFNPHRILARLTTPALLPIGTRFATAQSSLDLARTALALERYRLQHGAWPESLAALPALPKDVIGGAPLHYRLEADGRFTLYAIGWNARDDGGVTVWKGTTSQGVDWKAGDWVWPTYPQPEAAK